MRQNRMMILKTGNNTVDNIPASVRTSLFCLHRIKKNDGISFVQVMVTLMIMSLGFVSLLNVYRISIDRMSHLTNRIYLQLIQDNRLTFIDYSLRAYQKLPFDIRNNEETFIGSRKIQYDQTLQIHAMGDFLNIFFVGSSLNWKEGQKIRSLNAERYIANFRLDS